MALIMTVYNIKRVLNILSFHDLMEKFRTWKPNYKAIGWLYTKWKHISALRCMIFLQNENALGKYRVV